MSQTNENQKTSMLYGLDDVVPPAKNVIYALQHLIYILAGSVVLPVAVGSSLGLGQAEIASMLQRTFVLSGAASILQALFGHRYPIVDGPAGLWMGVIVAMATTIQSSGGNLATLRVSLQLGMIVGGVILVLLGAFGLVNWFAKKFTPIINGTLLILIVIQLSGSVMKNAFGVTGSNAAFQWKSLVAFLLTVTIIIVINLKTTGFIRSIATLIGVAVGWGASMLLGLTADGLVVDSIISIPQPFAWGSPTLDWSVLITCILCSLIMLSNFYISVHGMADVLGETVAPKKLRRSTMVLGAVTALCGVFPTVGYCPFASSMGVTAMTRVAARRPFVLGGVFIVILGLIGPVGSFFATIPPSVGYGATMIIFALILAQGLRELQKVAFTNRESLIVGISVIIGAGVMFLPSSAFSGMPDLLRYMLSNGLVDGFLVAFLLDNVLLKKRRVLN